MIKNSLCSLILAAGISSGCASMPSADRIARTALIPAAVARDTVDMPLAFMTNFCDAIGETGMKNTGETSTYSGWSSKKGFGIGIGVNVTGPAGKALGWGFAGVDYILCRSVVPNFPYGISPYIDKEQDLKDLFFPNMRALCPEQFSTYTSSE